MHHDFGGMVQLLANKSQPPLISAGTMRFFYGHRIGRFRHSFDGPRVDRYLHDIYFGFDFDVASLVASQSGDAR